MDYLTHSAAAVLVWNQLESHFLVKRFLSLFCNELNGGASSWRRLFFSVFQKLCYDLCADFLALEVWFHDHVRYEKINSVSDEPAHGDGPALAEGRNGIGGVIESGNSLFSGEVVPANALAQTVVVFISQGIFLKVHIGFLSY